MLPDVPANPVLTLRKLKLMTEANKIVEKISRPGMNKMQRLRASFDYVKKQYTYYCWREFRNTQDWGKGFRRRYVFPRRTR